MDHIPILMYHDIAYDNVYNRDSNVDNIPYVLAFKKYATHMQYIKDRGIETNVISNLENIIGSQQGEGGPSRVIITFDDGDISNYSIAYKMLIDMGLKATFFISSGRIDTPKYVTREHLCEMCKSGMEIGSHSVSHANFSQLSESQIMNELMVSKNVLENILGQRIKSFSIPTGYNHPKLIHLVKEAGYSYLCTSRIGYFNPRREELLNIPRIAIKRNMKNGDYINIVNGSMGLSRKIICGNMMGMAKKMLGVRGYQIIRHLILSRNHALTTRK